MITSRIVLSGLAAMFATASPVLAQGNEVA